MSLIRIVAALVIAFYSIAASAEIDSKGIANVTYKGFGSPSGEYMEQALSQAKLSAISRWASSQGGNFLKNYEAVRADVEANIDGYILGENILTEKVDKDAKKIKIVIRATIDDVRLKNLVNSASVVANVSGGDKSYMTFVFVSRRQTQVNSYDAKVYKREDKSQAEEGQENEAVSGGGVSYSASARTSDTSTTGGSTTRKADKIKYDVASADEINISMTEIFSSSGFEIVEAEYLEEETAGLISVDAFKQDFKAGSDISSQTKRNAAKGAKMVDVPFIALGTLDIGIKEKDSATGLTRVTVTVTGKMLNVESRFPKTVAAVGPVQIAGLGPNQTVAERNALKKAAQKAATELVNQLNSKGLM